METRLSLILSKAKAKAKAKAVWRVTHWTVLIFMALAESIRISVSTCRSPTGGEPWLGLGVLEPESNAIVEY